MRLGWLVQLAVPLACGTAGSAWMAEPLDGDFTPAPPERAESPESGRRATRDLRTRVIGSPELSEAPGLDPQLEKQPRKALIGKVLGTFRNTYYDFPSEADFDGAPVGLMGTDCKPIASVPRAFYESVCVQGSGTLKSGGTVSFAKRDCACAAECPRTAQHICFDLLDSGKFPWGRGATGKAITPLVTVAVDSQVIPLGTALYIPEYEGIPRDAAGGSVHDGCFIAEDRGMAVKGEHVDVFTGHRSTTLLWNRLVPTGKGVTVVLKSPRCTR